MQEAIKIVSVTPNFGECPIHNQQIIKICHEIECSPAFRYCCSECEPIHKSHRSESTEDYTRSLVQKLQRLKPSKKQKQVAIGRVFEKIHQQALLFQEELESTVSILNSINVRKFSVIKCIIKLNENQLLDQFCQWGLRENSEALERIVQQLQQMNFQHDKAEQLYKSWSEDIQNQMLRLKNYTAVLRDQAFQITNKFDYTSIVRSMKQISSIKVPRPDPEKEKPLPQSVIPQINPPPHPQQVEIAQEIFDIHNKDKTQHQILEMLQQMDTSSLTTINLDRNSMGTEGFLKFMEFKLTNLKKLIISNNLLEQSCLTIILQQRQKLPNLQILDLTGNFIDVDQSFEQIIKINQAWPDLQFHI